MNALGSSNTVPAAGADVLAAAACLRRERRGIAVRTCSHYRNAVILVAGNEDVAQVVFQNEGQKLVIWLGDCPAIFFVVRYF